MTKAHGSEREWQVQFGQNEGNREEVKAQYWYLPRMRMEGLW